MLEEGGVTDDALVDAGVVAVVVVVVFEADFVALLDDDGDD